MKRLNVRHHETKVQKKNWTIFWITLLSVSAIGCCPTRPVVVANQIDPYYPSECTAKALAERYRAKMDGKYVREIFQQCEVDDWVEVINRMKKVESRRKNQ